MSRFVDPLPAKLLESLGETQGASADQRPLVEELAEGRGFFVSDFEHSPLMADVFAWGHEQIGDPGSPHVTVIPDFNASPVADGGDVLSLKDLLQPAGEAALDDLTQFLHFERSDEGTVLHVSQAGGFAPDAGNVPHAENLQIVLQNVDLTHNAHGDSLSSHQIIHELMRVGKLLTDV